MGTIALQLQTILYLIPARSKQLGAARITYTLRTLSAEKKYILQFESTSSDGIREEEGGRSGLRTG